MSLMMMVDNEMDVIVNTRLEEIENYLREHEVYDHCGLDVYQFSGQISQSLLRDVKMLQSFSRAWGIPSSKYHELMITMAVLNRRLHNHDSDGSLWCIREANKILMRHMGGGRV